MTISDPNSILIISGGYSRNESGNAWSEAKTYLAIAQHFGWLVPGVSERVFLEEYSRDSFENVLLSLCRFKEITGNFPKKVFVISWAFKEARFDFHRQVIHFPGEKFEFIGANQPTDLAFAIKGETIALAAFHESFYGNSGKLLEKKIQRNPLNRQHPHKVLLSEFFNFIEDPANKQSPFPGKLPWE
jgi:hypothetical protein